MHLMIVLQNNPIHKILTGFDVIKNNVIDILPKFGYDVNKVTPLNQNLFLIMSTIPHAKFGSSMFRFRIR